MENPQIWPEFVALRGAAICRIDPSFKASYPSLKSLHAKRVQPCLPPVIARHQQVQSSRVRRARYESGAEFVDDMVIMERNSRFAPGSEITPVALTELRPGESGVIEGFTLPNETQEALARFGFVAAIEITVVRRAPMGDPSVYGVDGSEVALRAETARGILVSRLPVGPKQALA